MHKVLVIGAGNIGSLIACLFAGSNDYLVYLADKKLPIVEVPLQNLSVVQLDISDKEKTKEIIQQHQIQIIISCLPYYYNVEVAELAKNFGLHYFDLTEDVAVAEQIKKIARGVKQVFMPRCGLAPGFVNILANDMMQQFQLLEAAEIRVGDLPVGINNSLQYALTWSTDGLINEYGNVCYGIADKQKVALQPLDDLEMVEIDGNMYEAFNTSGGVGSLVDSYENKLKKLNYKTIRYPGHCEKMRFLMQDLALNQDRPLLKQILEKILPRTTQDVVLIYISITGHNQAQLRNNIYINKIYPQEFFNKQWSAIQSTTASGLCAVVDIVLNNLDRYHGYVLQEQINLQDFLNNRFGKIFTR